MINVRRILHVLRRPPRGPLIATIGLSEIPPGEIVYAIGDLHGMDTLLAQLLAMIMKDIGPTDQHVNLVILGDLIDRGPASAGVIDALLERASPKTEKFSLVVLKGNHEDMFLSFMENPEATGAHWLSMGGDATLASYGVQCPKRPTRRELRRLRDKLRLHMPRAHVDFLSALPLTFSRGDYFFCHAGARDGVPLDRQREDDLLWIRAGFADRDAAFEKIVVHGHTPVPAPELRRHRINIDTGAYATGRLTAVKLHGRSCDFLEAVSPVSSRTPRVPGETIRTMESNK